MSGGSPLTVPEYFLSLSQIEGSSFAGANARTSTSTLVPSGNFTGSSRTTVPLRMCPRTVMTVSVKGFYHLCATKGDGDQKLETWNQKVAIPDPQFPNVSGHD